MQTFLPHPSYELSAQALDNRRLGKQRVETKQIVIVLTDGYPSGAWRNHPAVRMWRGHTYALCMYGVAVCWEWRMRGHEDTLWEWFGEQAQRAIDRDEDLSKPSWFGDPAFHASHQSNLLRKDPSWYEAYEMYVTNDLPYVWPVPIEKPARQPARRQPAGSVPTSRPREPGRLTRKELLAALAEAGYSGPVSYTAGRLAEIFEEFSRNVLPAGELLVD